MENDRVSRNKQKIRDIVIDQCRDDGWIPQDIPANHSIVVGHKTITHGTNPLCFQMSFLEFADEWLDKNDPSGYFYPGHVEELGDTMEAEKYVLQCCDWCLERATAEQIEEWIDEYENCY